MQTPERPARRVVTSAMLLVSLALAAPTPDREAEAALDHRLAPDLAPVVAALPPVLLADGTLYAHAGVDALWAAVRPDEIGRAHV